MTNTNEIPKPSDSGSDGSQIIGESSPELMPSDQLQELSIAHTVQGIASSKARAFGGEVTSALIAGITSQLSTELQFSKGETLKLQGKNEHLAQQLSDERVKNAVLGERLKAFQTTRHLRNFGIAVGTALGTTSIVLFDTVQFKAYGYAALGIGILLMLAGWFVPVRGGDK